MLRKLPDDGYDVEPYLANIECRRSLVYLIGRRDASRTNVAEYRLRSQGGIARHDVDFHSPQIRREAIARTTPVCPVIETDDIAVGVIHTDSPSLNIRPLGIMELDIGLEPMTS